MTETELLRLDADLAAAACALAERYRREVCVPLGRYLDRHRGLARLESGVWFEADEASGECGS